MEITRTLGTYSHLYWLMYLLVAAAAGACVWGIRLRIRRWRLGQGSLRDRLGHPWRRILDLAVDMTTHRRFRRSSHPWLFHAFFLWGFGIFLLGTICVMLQEKFGLPTFGGMWYLILSLALDLFAILVLGGLFWAAWRRWVRQPEELSRAPGDGMVLALITLVVASGLLLEGVRIAQNPEPWALWSPVGYWLSGGLSGIEGGVLSSLHQGLWWGHLLLSGLFLAVIPFSRLFHLIASPAALFFVDPKAAHALVPLDFSDEEAESFGVSRIEDFHWKRLLDADGCTGCGRCQVECPAWQSGKPLSPKDVGETLSNCLADYDRDKHPGRSRNENKVALSLTGDVVRDEALWACTTCRACEVYCPVGIEHVPRFIDMRRFLVLTEARFPNELQTAFRGLERQGNPWGLDYQENAAKLELPTLADEPEAEVLLWTGCAGIYDPRYRQVIVALAGLLKEAGIRFAVPGEEMVCCGDAARRLGNEYLFQDLAQRNIAALEESGVRRIVTPCPHCLNTLCNEYSQFGGDFQVMHHSVLLRDLLAEKRLPISGLQNVRAAFHDPCYLARYADEVEAPRTLLAVVAGQPVELDKHGDESFCCGGGGGRMWLEENADESIAEVRVQQILDSGVPTVATACPFCLTMLSDGTKRREVDIRIMDLAEILAENLISEKKEGADGC